MHHIKKQKYQKVQNTKCCRKKHLLRKLPEGGQRPLPRPGLPHSAWLVLRPAARRSGGIKVRPPVNLQVHRFARIYRWNHGSATGELASSPVLAPNLGLGAPAGSSRWQLLGRPLSPPFIPYKCWPVSPSCPTNVGWQPFIPYKCWLATLYTLQTLETLARQPLGRERGREAAGKGEGVGG